ncbi:MAG: aspartate aminotransferase family protein, partial [Candidatus Nanopelagicaceae bacterium]
MAEFIPNPARGKEVYDLDRNYVFHSWSAQGQITPLPIAGGSGSYFWDFDGK